MEQNMKVLQEKTADENAEIKKRPPDAELPVQPKPKPVVK